MEDKIITEKDMKKKQTSIEARRRKRILIITICIVCVLGVLAGGGYGVYSYLAQNAQARANVEVSIICTKYVNDAPEVLFDEPYSLNLYNANEKQTTPVNVAIERGTKIEYTYSVYNKTDIDANYYISFNWQNKDNIRLVYRSDVEQFDIARPLTRTLPAQTIVAFTITILVDDELSDSELKGDLILSVDRESE